MSDDATADDGLFSREEVLSGAASAGDVRRARAVVYLIEQEATRAADRRRAISATAMTIDRGAFLSIDQILDPEALRGPLPGEADEAYIESFRAARRESTDAGLKLIERHTEDWLPLVPPRLDLRARTFDLLSRRYDLDRRRCSRLCAAFGVDDPAFAAAYERVARRPLDEAFVASKGGFLGRLRRR